METRLSLISKARRLFWLDIGFPDLVEAYLSLFVDCIGLGLHEEYPR